MKNLLFLFITLLVLISCSKEDNKPTSPIDQLPPATQIGANTAGCLLDGKAFLPKGYLHTGNLVCYYIDGKDFTISLSQKLNNQTILIGIISNNQSLVIGQTYILKEYGANSQFGEYNISRYWRFAI
jgi:hypothetical protein